MIESKQIKVKLSEFFNKNKLKILIVVVIIICLLLVNYFLRMYKKDEPITTKEPFATIMNPQEKFPSKMYIESEALIISFANKASNGDYDAAYNLLSNDCKREVFPIKENFIQYAKINFPKNSRYEVIPYSKVGTTYIYQVKVFEDFLATGLTYSNYSYIDLKMAINENIKGEKTLSIAGYMGQFPINSVFENDYVKIEIVHKNSFYTKETYSLKITNRTENEIIIRDFSTNNSEIQLSTGGDARPEISKDTQIYLSPFEEKGINFTFSRFFDETSIPNSIVFSNIRVVKKGKTVKYNENDILAKFSIAVDIVY